MNPACDYLMGTPQKRARNLGYELRLLIPSRVAGSVIGKGGSNISRLRSENKASISVPDCAGPERIISIAADEQELAFNVLSQILPLIEDATRDRNHGENADQVEVRLLFHHTQVGCIIGKAGSKIKELRESTSTQIKVYGSCCPHSTDRVAAVSGPPDMVLNAIKSIASLVVDNPPKGLIDPYDPHHYDEVYSSQYGGYGETRGAGGGGNERFGRAPMGGGRMMGGGPRGGQRGYRGEGGYGRGSGGGGGGGGRQRGSSNGSGSLRQDEDGEYGDEEKTTTQVTIPKEFAGAIIGKGGTRIRRIRSESGASITIDEALPGAPDRVITITGGSGQIRMAQYLLQQSVKDHGAATDRKF